MHQQRASACQESIQGSARSKDLAQAILRAQLQSLQHALQALKVSMSKPLLYDLLKQLLHGKVIACSAVCQVLGCTVRWSRSLLYENALAAQSGGCVDSCVESPSLPLQASYTTVFLQMRRQHFHHTYD